MTHVAEPGQSISTHDLILISGSTEVPLILCNSRGDRDVLSWTREPLTTTSLKMYSGEQKYSDLTPPWTPVAQTDWSGGRGSKDFDNDSTMYFDGNNVNTLRPGEVILGPKATQISLTPPCTNTLKAGYFDTILAGTPTAATYYNTFRFTAATSITATSVTVSLFAYQEITDTGSLQVGLTRVDTGAPNATDLAATISTTTLTLADIPNRESTDYNFTLGAALGLTAETDYFLVFKFTSLDTTPAGYYVVFSANSTTALAANEEKYSWNGTDWTSGTQTYEPWFTIYGADKDCKWHYFEYKGALYAVGQNDDGATNKLYINGDQGVVETGGSATSVISSSGVKTWTANEAAGSKLCIIRGTGTNQPQWWRPITANDATGTTGAGKTVFTVSPAFDVVPADNDLFVITASDDWTEVAGFNTNYETGSSGIIPGVQDVLSVNGAVYFAMGVGAVITRMYAYNSGGTWTYNYSDFGTYTAGSVTEDATNAKFTFLKYGVDKDFKPVIWGATGGYPSTIYKATPVDYTAKAGSNEAALVWSSAINVGNLQERITGLEIYTSPYNGIDTLHIMKEHSIHYLYNDLPIEYSIREFRNTRDMRNGKAATVHGVYLYFSWHNTILRYYNGMLDRIGPDKAEVGFPTANRVGNCVALTGYPGMVIAAYDAGTSGVSTVIAYNQQGWCELYRGTLGKRIQNLYVQSIQGNTVDRLWISEGGSMTWIPLSIDPFNHPDSSYYFETTGELTTAWYYIGVQGVNKLFNSMRLVIDNVLADYEEIKCEYQTDDATDWTEIYGDMDTYVFDTFSEEIDLATTPSVSGKRIRFKFTLISHDGAETPRLVASVLEAITRIPTKYVTTFTARLVDDDTQRDNAPDSVRLAATKWTNLLAFQAQSTPVLTECGFAMLDNIYAFVDDVTPIALALEDAEGTRTKYIVRIRLIEV